MLDSDSFLCSSHGVLMCIFSPRQAGLVLNLDLSVLGVLRANNLTDYLMDVLHARDLSTVRPELIIRALRGLKVANGRKKTFICIDTK